MSSERVYVAIDLETTGLKAQQDAIIEIGAVRFTCAPQESGEIQVLDRFVTFVNPGRPVPLRIQQITGITNADVASAPVLSQIAPELLGFVSSDTRYTVAHNAGFDSAFLSAGGIDFSRPMQDTFELATIFLPGAASYSLGELARWLTIPLPDAHRALDDAEATAWLFGAILHEAACMPPGIRRILLHAGREAAWPPLFLLADMAFGEMPTVTTTSMVAIPSHGPRQQSVPRLEDEDGAEDAPAHPTWQPDLADISGFYAPGGYLADHLGALYEFRSGQAEMSQRVMDSLSAGDHLLIEAGTGTGKTLAYLLPAALYAMRNGERVVIATNTIALQDQILDKDIPLVRSLLARAHTEQPRAALLKGRGNYLCTRRLRLWYRNRALNAQELSLLAKILVWLQCTRTGDVSELFLHNPVEQAMWQFITSDAASCTPDRCAAACSGDRDVLGPQYRDFFHQARRAAEAAQLVVVNHALLLTDIEAGGRVLPPFDNVIIDEAHRFEEAATDVLTFRADWNLLARWLRELQPAGDMGQQIIMACTQDGDISCRDQYLHIGSLSTAADAAIQDFSQALLTFLSNHQAFRADSGYTQRIAIDRAFRTQPAWSELEIDWDRVSHTLAELTDRLQRLVLELADKNWWHKEPYVSYVAELTALAERLNHARILIDEIIYGEGDVQIGKQVSWAEVDDRRADARLVCAPLYVSDRLETELIHDKRSVILTGATLRTGSGFGYIRERLGLWDVTASTVASPFDYQASTLLIMPADLPDPQSTNYQRSVERAIQSAALAAGGSTVALFTSHAQLRTTAEAIRAPLDQAGITVLEHGWGSRRRLLREYRETERAVLLGTRSFWEGIDLPGDELTCLLIVRLPFAVPSDPLVAARAADLENPFRDYTLPDAILRFRQGFGRLIRRSTDRGVVVILDSRMWRKEYGSAFRESLPACTEKHPPLDMLFHEVHDWLNHQGEPS